ncbi:MAG: sugar phosphate isomerase/epimerase [Rhizobiales bacterium]|nr:sugar phosphate isomerase/epimerase [Hyphomicrobiales bacterium]
MLAGFHSVGLSADPILTVIQRAAAAGYDAIELNAETLPWTGPHVTPATPPEERAAIREAAALNGLVISAVGAHVAMVEDDAEARRKAIAFVDGCTDLAVDVGAPVVHILSGPAPAGVPEATAWKWFADAVVATSSHADSRGVSLAIEAIAGHLFHRIDDYSRLAADLGAGIKVNFDPSHLIVQGEDPARLVAEHGPDIVHVHMKDGAGRYPAFTFPLLGQGAIDFAGLVKDLRGAGYDGVLSVEYEAQVYGFRETGDEILVNGRNYLKDLTI